MAIIALVNYLNQVDKIWYKTWIDTNGSVKSWHKKRNTQSTTKQDLKHLFDNIDADL